MPDPVMSYKVSAVYYMDTSETIMRSKLIKIAQEDVSVIVLHHYSLDVVLQIFEMVAS